MPDIAHLFFLFNIFITFTINNCKDSHSDGKEIGKNTDC